MSGHADADDDTGGTVVVDKLRQAVDVQVQQKFDNVYFVTLTYPDGTEDMIYPPASPVTRLLLEEELYELLHEEARYVVSETPEIVLSPTDALDQFWLIHDDFSDPILTKRRDSEAIVTGIYQMEANDNGQPLRDVIATICSDRVRTRLMSRLLTELSAERVYPSEDGWVIDDVFLLTWNAEIFYNESSHEGYRPTGDKVGSNIPAFKLARRTNEMVADEMTLPSKRTYILDGEECRLTDVELEFVTKVQFLLNLEEILEDRFAGVETIKPILKRELHGEETPEVRR